MRVKEIEGNRPRWRVRTHLSMVNSMGVFYLFAKLEF